MDLENKSVEELLNKAYHLSLKLAYETVTWKGNYFDVRENFKHGGDVDKIFSYCDGLQHKYYDKVTSGRCSIQTTIDFDIEKFEENLIIDIKEFEKLLLIYGEPRILSKECLRERGYRGEMAGYTKEEEFEYDVKYWNDLLNKSLGELELAKGYNEKYHIGNAINSCKKRLKELLDSRVISDNVEK